MLNYIWLGLLVLAVLIGGFHGRMQQTVDGAVKSAETAVTLAIGLVGIMALWLGMMRLAEKAGLVQAIARLLRPLLVRVFPDVPARHPAMGSMVMNIAANMLGLNNAATPLGLRAMKDLETLNPNPGTATNAMCTFLAINTSSVQLIPVTAIAVLAAAGARQPTAIVGTAFLATCCSTAAGLVAVKLLEKMPMFRLPSASRSGGDVPASVSDQPSADAMQPSGSTVAPMPVWGRFVVWGLVGCFLWFFLTLSFPGTFGPTATPAQPGNALVRSVNAVSLLAIPFLLSFFPLYAAFRGIPVYEEFIQGAKEGFDVALRIIPFLVAILVAIGMFRGAGGIDLLTKLLRPVLDLVQFPAELLPLSLVRPLSGSGALALFTDLVRAHGADHMLSRMGATIFGSTETTFYVVVVYFGSISVRRTRHAIPAGLIADGVGIVASVFICRWVFGN